MQIEINKQHKRLLTILSDLIKAIDNLANNKSAMEVSKLQKSISQDIFTVHDIDTIQKINNLIKQ